MTSYIPDKWVVVKITLLDKNPVYKVFACWSGGFTTGDSWRLNSGVTRVTLVNKRYEFQGSTGSAYLCHIGCYGSTVHGHSVLQNMITNAAAAGVVVEIMPEDTDWLAIDYE
jgi:hypothetical protein